MSKGEPLTEQTLLSATLREAFDRQQITEGGYNRQDWPNLKVVLPILSLASSTLRKHDLPACLAELTTVTFFFRSDPQGSTLFLTSSRLFSSYAWATGVLSAAHALVFTHLFRKARSLN